MEDEQAARWTLQGPGQGGRCRLRPKRHSSHTLSSLMAAQPAVRLPWPWRGGHQAGTRGHTPTCPGTEGTRDPPTASGQKLWFCFKFLSLRKLSREQARGGGQGQRHQPEMCLDPRAAPHQPQAAQEAGGWRLGWNRLPGPVEVQGPSPGLSLSFRWTEHEDSPRGGRDRSGRKGGSCRKEMAQGLPPTLWGP